MGFSLLYDVIALTGNLKDFFDNFSAIFNVKNTQEIHKNLCPIKIKDKKTTVLNRMIVYIDSLRDRNLVTPVWILIDSI